MNSKKIQHMIDTEGRLYFSQDWDRPVMVDSITIRGKTYFNLTVGYGDRPGDYQLTIEDVNELEREMRKFGDLRHWNPEHKPDAKWRAMFPSIYGS